MRLLAIGLPATRFTTWGGTETTGINNVAGSSAIPNCQDAGRVAR
jgi:hypothetical protein